MITDDIKNRMVRKCGNFAGVRRDIYMYYCANRPSTADFAVYLKQKWGQGGAYPALTVGDTEYSYSTLEYKKNGVFIEEYKEYRKNGIIDSVLLSWTEVAKRTAELIADGEFLVPHDYASDSAWSELFYLRWN